MITITIFQKKDLTFSGFKCLGHAGFADSGSDIICAGVSTLVINTINSIESLTSSEFQVDTDEESGLIDFRFRDVPDQKAELLVNSMILGLQGIQEDYGDEYVVLGFKEV